MNNNNHMYSFLSERNLELHKNYTENCSHKLSIIAKSGYDISGKTYPELRRARFLGGARSEILGLASDIYYHKLYFSSFSNGGTTAPCLKVRYSSAAGFLYEAECAAMTYESTFMLVYFDGRSAVIADARQDLMNKYGEPRLALDLYEHAYFLDYGFDKKAYVRAALSRFDLSRIDKF